MIVVVGVRQRGGSRDAHPEAWPVGCVSPEQREQEENCAARDWTRPKQRGLRIF